MQVCRTRNTNISRSFHTTLFASCALNVPRYGAALIDECAAWHCIAFQYTSARSATDCSIQNSSKCCAERRLLHKTDIVYREASRSFLFASYEFGLPKLPPPPLFSVCCQICQRIIRNNIRARDVHHVCTVEVIFFFFHFWFVAISAASFLFEKLWIGRTIQQNMTRFSNDVQ